MRKREMGNGCGRETPLKSREGMNAMGEDL